MKKKSHLTNFKEMEEARRQLRNNSTSAEATLWKYLKNRKLDGRKFRRQFSVDNVILDFFCVTENLCIELDGHDHFTEEGMKRDEKRDLYLKQFGIQVIRIENKAIWNNLAGTLAEIRKHFKTKSSTVT